MVHRYSRLKRFLKTHYRKFFPVPKSPWTKGAVDDIGAIHLVPPKRLKNFFSDCIDRLQKERSDNNIGNYMEFGVFNGSSIGSMWLTAQKRGLLQMNFFGFDSFQGLPEESESEDDGVREKGFYACSFDQMRKCLLDRGVNPDGITRINGRYQDTLHKNTANKYNINNPGIVFIDCDTYSSSKSVLNFIAPMIKQPTIICFDDRKLNDLDLKEMGEYKAFNEFLEENPCFIAREIPSYNRKSKTFMMKKL